MTAGHSGRIDDASSRGSEVSNRTLTSRPSSLPPSPNHMARVEYLSTHVPGLRLIYNNNKKIDSLCIPASLSGPVQARSIHAPA